MNPSWYCSAILDGAEKYYCFRLPHAVSKTKNDREIYLKVWLVDILKHSKPNKLFLFSVTDELKISADVVVEAAQRFASKRPSSGAFSPALFTQFKNCI